MWIIAGSAWRRLLARGMSLQIVIRSARIQFLLLCQRLCLRSIILTFAAFDGLYCAVVRALVLTWRFMVTSQYRFDNCFRVLVGLILIARVLILCDSLLQFSFKF